MAESQLIRALFGMTLLVALSFWAWRHGGLNRKLMIAFWLCLATAGTLHEAGWLS
jgi:hypothetical protein